MKSAFNWLQRTQALEPSPKYDDTQGPQPEHYQQVGLLIMTTCVGALPSSANDDTLIRDGSVLLQVLGNQAPSTRVPTPESGEAEEVSRVPTGGGFGPQTTGRIHPWVLSGNEMSRASLL